MIRKVILLGALVSLVACSSTGQQPVKISQLEPEKPTQFARCLYEDTTASKGFTVARVGNCDRPNFSELVAQKYDYTNMAIPSVGTVLNLETGQPDYFIEVLAALSYNVILENAVMDFNGHQFESAPMKVKGIYDDFAGGAILQIVYQLPKNLVDAVLAKTNAGQQAELVLELKRPIGDIFEIPIQLDELKLLATMHDARFKQETENPKSEAENRPGGHVI